MTLDLAVVLALLLAAVAMFAANRPRMDVVGIIMIVLLTLTGSVSLREALAGFSDSSVVLIGALFVIGEGLVRTGVAQRLGDLLMARAGGSELRLMVLLMAAVAVLGSVMSSTGVVAIFIPIVLRIAQNTGIPPGRLMMPLSAAALISGMMTLIGTAPNLVVNAELARHGIDGFHFFSFTPFGVPVLVLGILYMSVARRWLGAGRGEQQGAGRPSLRDWVRDYGLAGREYRVRIRDSSPLIGRTIADLDLRKLPGINILAIERMDSGVTKLLAPAPAVSLRTGDSLLLDFANPDADQAALRDAYAVDDLPVSGAYFSDRRQEIGMAEVVLPATSALVGRTVLEAGLGSRFGVTVVGIRRGAAPLQGTVTAAALHAGDVLLAVGGWPAIRGLREQPEDLVLLNMPTDIDAVLPAPSRAPYAVACLVLVVGLMVSGVVPNVIAALIGCLLMGATGCVDMPAAYRSINWQSLILIVGMLPFSAALQRTGGVDLAADGMLALTGGVGVHATLAAVFMVTALLGLFISNTATAVLMAPVALAIAADLHLSPYPFAMTVALASSAAFMTPVSSPVNTLVVTPGGYGFMDFVRIGVPMTVLTLIATVLLVPIVLPP
jgi:di/tricarboxylate transporter